MFDCCEVDKYFYYSLYIFQYVGYDKNQWYMELYI